PSGKATESKSIFRAISHCPITATTKCLPIYEGNKGEQFHEKKDPDLLARVGIGSRYRDRTTWERDRLRPNQLPQRAAPLLPAPAAPASTPEELRKNHRATESCPTDGSIRQKHACPLSSVVFAVAKGDLTQHLREHSLVN